MHEENDERDGSVEDDDDIDEGTSEDADADLTDSEDTSGDDTGGSDATPPDSGDASADLNGEVSGGSNVTPPAKRKKKYSPVLPPSHNSTAQQHSSTAFLNSIAQQHCTTAFLNSIPQQHCLTALKHCSTSLLGIIAVESNGPVCFKHSPSCCRKPLYTISTLLIPDKYGATTEFVHWFGFSKHMSRKFPRRTVPQVHDALKSAMDSTRADLDARAAAHLKGA